MSDSVCSISACSSVIEMATLLYIDRQYGMTCMLRLYHPESTLQVSRISVFSWYLPLLGRTVTNLSANGRDVACTDMDTQTS